MTKWKPKRPALKRLRRHAVDIDFDGGTLTSDGGIVLLREVVDGLRRLGLSGSNQSRWRVDTIRLRLFKIAARVRVTARRVVFHLSSHSPSEAIFERVLAHLCRSG